MSMPLLDLSDLLRGRNRLRPHWPDFRQLTLDFDYGDSERAVLVSAGDDEERIAEELDTLLEEVPSDFDDLPEPEAYAHWVCLIWHVNAFLHARTQRQRDEVLQWFVQPPQIEWFEGDISRINPAHVPFSFELCCVLEEIDSDEFRAAILNLNTTLQGKPLRRRKHAQRKPRPDPAAPGFASASAQAGRDHHPRSLRRRKRQPHPGLGPAS